jgi:hypothetical protein
MYAMRRNCGAPTMIDWSIAELEMAPDAAKAACEMYPGRKKARKRSRASARMRRVFDCDINARLYLGMEI